MAQARPPMAQAQAMPMAQAMPPMMQAMPMAPMPAPMLAPDQGWRYPPPKHALVGGSLQAVDIQLEPGEQIISEAGALLFMDPGITFECHMSDGSQPRQGFLGKMKQGFR